MLLKHVHGVNPHLRRPLAAGLGGSTTVKQVVPSYPGKNEINCSVEMVGRGKGLMQSRLPH